MLIDLDEYELGLIRRMAEFEARSARGKIAQPSPYLDAFTATINTGEQSTRLGRAKDLLAKLESAKDEDHARRVLEFQDRQEAKNGNG